MLTPVLSVASLALGDYNLVYTFYTRAAYSSMSVEIRVAVSLLTNEVREARCHDGGLGLL